MSAVRTLKRRRGSTATGLLISVLTDELNIGRGDRYFHFDVRRAAAEALFDSGVLDPQTVTVHDWDLLTCAERCGAENTRRVVAHLKRRLGEEVLQKIRANYPGPTKSGQAESLVLQWSKMADAARFADESWLEYFISLIEDGSQLIRSNAIEAIRAIAIRTKPAGLSDRLYKVGHQKTSFSDREALCRLMLEIGEPRADEISLDYLIPLIQDASPVSRKKAIEAISAIAIRANPAGLGDRLYKAERGTSPVDREAICRIMLEIGDSRAMSLMYSLGSSNPGSSGSADDRPVVQSIISILRDYGPRVGLAVLQRFANLPDGKFIITIKRDYDWFEDQPIDCEEIRSIARYELETRVPAEETAKGSIVLEMIQQPDGATLSEIRKATKWPTHIVHRFISGVLCTMMRIKVKSEERPDGECVYTIG